MRTTIIGVILAVMIGWAFFEAFSSDENDQQSQGEPKAEVPAGEEFQLVESEEGETQQPGDWLRTGESAPDFTLETLAGEQISLSDLQGQKVIVNFWASWCPPCRAEMPEMQDFYMEHGDSVEILAVNLTQTEPGVEQVEDFRDDFGVSFPILLDQDIKVANLYDIQPIPTSYFVDSEGIIQHISIGPMTYDMMVNETKKMD
ncbi:redoxin domain-containing protein [Bacillus piscicola]|uniref:redoxin domain-containing protein n=1 Tax=Bacillus piscicola TaxID=1632684 RepID=UPI001F08B78E|nr:redoxin domain-containing protein [Bacillus piscicola]